MEICQRLLLQVFLLFHSPFLLFLVLQLCICNTICDCAAVFPCSVMVCFRSHHSFFLFGDQFGKFLLTYFRLTDSFLSCVEFTDESAKEISSFMLQYF